MEIVRLPIDSIKEHPRNVRVHTKRNIDAIKKSLQNFEQVKPILIQKSTMFVIAGNGTLQAAKALGWKEIDCNILDLDDVKANALAIMDNKTTDLSEWDEKSLVDLLKELDDPKINLLDLTGFESEELDAMIKFQEGNLFDSKKTKINNKEKKKQENKNDLPVVEMVGNGLSYKDQISFVLLGFPFVTDNKEQVKELNKLAPLLIEADSDVKDDITKHVFDAIQDILTNNLIKE